MDSPAAAANQHLAMVADRLAEAGWAQQVTSPAVDWVALVWVDSVEATWVAADSTEVEEDLAEVTWVVAEADMVEVEVTAKGDSPR